MLPPEAYVAVILFLLILFNPIYISYSHNIDWKLLLEYIKVFIWPSLLLLFIKLFKTNISGFINKISELSLPGGIKATTKESAITAQSEEPELKPTIDLLTTEEKKAKITQESSDKDADQLKKELEVTQGNLTQALTTLLYEKTYRLIFPSQIRILREIFNTPSKTVRADVVFSNYKKTIWFPSYPFADYVNFLKNFLMIAETENGSYTITPLGIGFLEYIGTQGLPEKPNDIKLI